MPIPSLQVSMKKLLVYAASKYRDETVGSRISKFRAKMCILTPGETAYGFVKLELFCLFQCHPVYGQLRQMVC